MRFKFCFILSFFTVGIVAPNFLLAKENDERLYLSPSIVPNLHKVSDGIFRGGRPRNSDLSDLQKKENIRTVINIENDSQTIQREEEVTENLGMKYVSSPMSWSSSPNDKQIDQLLSSLRETRNHPVFIHCYFGRDRTGLVIGLYRVLVEGWAPQDAYREMLDRGFRPSFVALDSYFRRRTGMKENIENFSYEMNSTAYPVELE